MQTLIICIDRDNDLGEKADTSSPVIGRAANLDAAIKLASIDPEDSDINTIFGGINVYDKLIAENNNVEIVSIAGDTKVGVISDKKISEQFDKILEQLKPDRAILVSDGAEDESVMPIIQSRIKVDSVRRVIVKQHENLESTYYIIKQAFNDPKISHTFFMPLGLAFMIYAISVYAGHPEVAVIFITGAIGIYLLFRGLGLDDAFSNFKASLANSFHSGKITVIMYFAAIVLSLIGTTRGTIELWNYYNQGIWSGVLILLMDYINVSTWWYVVAGVLISSGEIFDMFLAKEKIGKIWSHPFFIVSGGILLWAGSTYILVITEILNSYPMFENESWFLFSTVAGAIIMATIGTWLSTRLSKNKK